MKESEFLTAFIGAITLFILLAGGIIMFVLLYARRVRQHQSILKEKERIQQLRLLNAAIAAQEEERRRIGADIHDDIGPMLATAKLLLSKFMYIQNKEETKQHVTKIGTQLDEVISQVRRVSRNLVPQVLVEFGLVAALEELCLRINEGDGIRTHLSTCDESTPLSGVEQLAIYRIIQEFCNNTIRHSGAKNIWIDHSIGEGYVQYTLRDDGRGIESDRLTGVDGLGINNMKARAKSIGARIVLDNGQTNGVVMSIKLTSEL